MRGATQGRTHADRIGTVNGLGRSRYTFNHLFDAFLTTHGHPLPPVPRAPQQGVAYTAHGALAPTTVRVWK
jgi:hypothetical protein